MNQNNRDIHGWQQAAPLRIIVTHIARYLLYFSILLVFISVFYGQLNKWKDIVCTLVTEHLRGEIEIPNTFMTILLCSLFFMAFTIVVSAIAVVREQNHFKSSLLLRIILFIMNILPIALFQNLLFRKFGFRTIYFFPVYLGVQFALDKFFKFIYRNIREGNRFWLVSSKIALEMAAVAISWMLINIPRQYRVFEKSYMDPSTLFELCIYFLYIVLFNSVSFFTIEYCMGIFREEYKKNYAKFYFLYNHNVIERVWFVLRKSLPQTLEKIKANITWLIAFIIPVEQMMENSKSLGGNILGAYKPYPDNPFETSLDLIRNIGYILLVMWAINVVFDLFIHIFDKRKSGNLNAVSETENNNKSSSSSPELCRQKPGIVLKIALPFVLVLFALAVFFNQKEYAFAGYYAFTKSNAVKTVGELFEKTSNTNYPPELLLKYRDTPLYQKAEKSNYYSIIEIDIEDKDGKQEKLFPYYDSADRTYYYIRGNANVPTRGISTEDKIVDIKTVEKYKAIAVTGKMTAFRLPADTDKSHFTGKPLYLIIPFYFCYLFILVIITALFTYLVYQMIVKFHINTDKTGNRILNVLIKGTNEALTFLNSLTIIIVFLLANLVLEKVLNIDWRSRGFLSTLMSYSLIQFIIIAMFTSVFAREIALHVKKLLVSNEFRYYDLIGIDNHGKYQIYSKKYGNILVLKLVFQNILFIFNINWFICYAFFDWGKQFNDTIGITYAISFENIFTKIISSKADIIDGFNIGILLAINIILFIGYYYYQKKLSTEQ